MKYLDKRLEGNKLDLKIAPSMTSRTEILQGDANGTDVTVQELINLVCDLLDGEQDHHLNEIVGEEMAPRVAEIRKAIRPLWTDPDGNKIC